MPIALSRYLTRSSRCSRDVLLDQEREQCADAVPSAAMYKRQVLDTGWLQLLPPPASIAEPLEHKDEN